MKFLKLGQDTAVDFAIDTDVAVVVELQSNNAWSFVPAEEGLILRESQGYRHGIRTARSGNRKEFLRHG
jgi:hypothetical protein